MLPENCFLFTRDDLAHAATALRGYAIFEDSVVFGTAGMTASARKPIAERGRFSASLVDRTTVRFITDRTGQDIHYLFRKGEDWAVSNSFLLLATWAADRSAITLYPPAVMGFHLKGGVHIGEQLLSHRTMIEEIVIVPATCDIVVDRGSGALSLERQKPPRAQGGDYASGLLDFLERGAGLIGALAEAGATLAINLSGGYDSRLVLAMALQGGAHDAIRLFSDPTKTGDFQAASALAEFHGLPLNPSVSREPSALSDGEAYRLWALSCAGTYLPVYPVAHSRLHRPKAFRLTGDQPTGWDFFAGTGQFKGPPTRIAEHIRDALSDRAHGDAVAADFLSVFKEIDFDPEHPRAMMAHYSAVRSRHHCGRQWYRSLGAERLLTALMDPAMLGLDLYAGERGWNVTQVLCDALSAFDDWALDMPFETPDRSFPPEMKARSPFAGGVRVTPRPMTVHGLGVADPAPSPPGLLDLPVRLRLEPETIKAHLEHGFWTAERVRTSGFFDAADIDAAKAEINAGGSLSHGFRRTTHIVFTEMVLDLVMRSGGGAQG